MVLQTGDGESDDGGNNLWARRPNTIGRRRVRYHVRAFAIMLAGDRRRADDLVRDTIELTFTAENRPRAGVDLRAQMFAVLHGLHSGRLDRGPAHSPQYGRSHNTPAASEPPKSASVARP
jgi:DNA-directed RNA polymerase specialized sigma24 family protein